MTDRMIVFDVDGVLVDVADSYRAAIQETVEHFSGAKITRETIQDYKNRGGWNDDWELSHRLIADAGVAAPYDAVVAEFNRRFLGDGSDGLILRERWLARPGTLEALAKRCRLAIFTGRRQFELAPTLARYAAALRFDPIVTVEMLENPKPAPDGLHKIAQMAPEAELWYVGDTIDDARAARAAGVPFIGIAGPSNPRREAAGCLLQAEGAVAVLDDVNQLEAALPQ